MLAKRFFKKNEYIISFSVALFLYFVSNGSLCVCVCARTRLCMLASRVSVFMDRSVNPCDDFYRFACGGWVKDSFIPADRPEVTIYTQMEEDVQVTLKSKSTFAVSSFHEQIFRL